MKETRSENLPLTCSSQHSLHNGVSKPTVDSGFAGIPKGRCIVPLPTPPPSFCSKFSLLRSSRDSCVYLWVSCFCLACPCLLLTKNSNGLWAPLIQVLVRISTWKIRNLELQNQLINREDSLPMDYGSLSSRVLLSRKVRSEESFETEGGFFI